MRTGEARAGKSSDRSPEVMRAIQGELERLDQEITRLHEDLPEPFTDESHDGGAHEYIDKASRVVKARLQALQQQLPKRKRRKPARD